MIRALILVFALLAALSDWSPLSEARPVQAASCTLIMGYSVTRDWYSSGSFETQPGITGSEWEMAWDGGASVRKIAYEGRWWTEWDADNLTSRCTSNSRMPDRVILHVGHRSDETGHDDPQPILDVVAQIRSRINPNAAIYLMGQIGSTTPATCNVFGDNVAADSLAGIRAAIALDPTLREAHTPAVICSQFADSKGHLTSAGASNAASQVSAWVMGLSEPPPEPPTLVSCERVATYNDGSTVKTPLDLGEC